MTVVEPVGDLQVAGARCIVEGPRNVEIVGAIALDHFHHRRPEVFAEPSRVLRRGGHIDVVGVPIFRHLGALPAMAARRSGSR